MKPKANAWAILGHDRRGLGKNMAVSAEEVPQGIYKSFDLQRTRTSFKN